MGYRTRHIDRIAEGGPGFDRTITASKAAPPGARHLSPAKTRTELGQTEGAGMPGATLGLQPQDPTIATALKAQGYATGQFAKRTTWVTATSTFLTTHGSSQSSSATCITSTPKRDPSCPTIRRTRRSGRSSGRAGFLQTGPTRMAPSASRTPGR